MRRPAPEHYAWETLQRTGWKVGLWVLIVAVGLALIELAELFGFSGT
jgi:hypothetical protein